MRNYLGKTSATREVRGAKVEDQQMHHPTYSANACRLGKTSHLALRTAHWFFADDVPPTDVMPGRRLNRADCADHLRSLTRSVIETLTDDRQRAHLTRVLDGTTGDSPARVDRYRPDPAVSS